MTSKHTPGPWQVVMGTRIGINGPRDHIGWPAPVAYNLGFVTDETALANARIMSAAPDMLEALVLAKTWLEGWASAERELAIINAAIAKAEGA